MRISAAEREHIKNTFLNYAYSSAQIFLFGSRTDANRKGGDIDLLILFDDIQDVARFQRLDFIVALKKLIGERRVDVTVASRAEVATDEFLRVAFSAAVAI